MRRRMHVWVPKSRDNKGNRAEGTPINETGFESQDMRLWIPSPRGQKELWKRKYLIG